MGQHRRGNGPEQTGTAPPPEIHALPGGRRRVGPDAVRPVAVGRRDAACRNLRIRLRKSRLH